MQCTCKTKTTGEQQEEVQNSNVSTMQMLLQGAGGCKREGEYVLSSAPVE
jgi:hypothetical protein